MVKKAHIFALASAGFLLVPAVQAETGHDFTGALTGGKATLDMRLRSETVSQESKPEDASALTLRTRLGYLTGDYEGFKAFMEMTNTSAFGDHDYQAPDPKGSAKTTYPKVADPELSRINQAWVSYSGIPDTAVKAGRQRVILDNARFVGNVGWRQTEQVYDALVVANTSLPDTTLIYGYVTRAYTIVGGDPASQSHLINVSYNGLSFGKITGYAYLLDLKHDGGAVNLSDNTKNALVDGQTLGLSFSGKHALSDSFDLLYHLEFANQSEYANSTDAVDTTYTKLELGGSFAGVTAKIGQETLGSNDDGTYGFQTPLATKHAFNGWADQFLVTPQKGLVDSYFSIGGKPMGVKLLAVYHTYTTDKDGDDLGKELNLLAAKKFGPYSVGLKYANYTDDTPAEDDVTKTWLWGQVKF